MSGKSIATAASGGRADIGRRVAVAVAPARLTTSVAWWLWAATAACSAANGWFLVLNRHARTSSGPATGWVEVVTGLGYLGFASVGLTLIARGRRNLLWWVFLVAGAVLAGAAVASEYATYALLVAPGALPGARAVAWLGSWTWWSAAGLGLSYGLLLYPDGSLPAPAWRRVGRVAAANIAILGLLHALTPGRLEGEYSIVVNPVGIDAARNLLRPLRDAGWLLLAVNAGLGLAAVLARRQAASGTQRQQLTWLAAAAGLALAAVPIWGLTSDDGAIPPAAQLIFGIAVVGVPLAVSSAAAQTSALRRSVERLVLAREEERRRIRRDLHDGLGPTLAGVTLQLDLARSLVRSDPEAAEALLGRLEAQVKASITDIRRLVDDLRPPVLDQLGLASAIREGTSYLVRRREGCELEVSVDVGGKLEGLPAALEVTAYRIVMEAVNNACHHGEASSCTVRLDLDRSLEITVEDDGVGLPRDVQPGVGLTSMQERAADLGGRCEVQPRPGGGTIVRAELPVKS